MNADRQQSGAGPGTALEAHTGLVFASAACALVTAGLLGAYAWSQGIALLGGLSLQLALAVCGLWAGWRARRLRDRFRAWEEESATEPDAARAGGRWSGQEPYDLDDDLIEVRREAVLHDRNVHFLFFEVGPSLVLGGLAVWLLVRMRVSGTPLPQNEAIVFGLVCLAASCAWIVFSRAYESLSDGALSDAQRFALLFREAQWASWLTAAGLLGALLWAPLETWLARVVVAWVVAICVEQLIRAVWVWRRAPRQGEDPVPLPAPALRQSLLTHGNPFTSLLEAFEQRFGVSFRSSWTIRFVRRAVVPVVMLSGVLYWGLTSLTLIGPSEIGIRERCGVVDAQLGPGLHGKLPWPFGTVRRFEVKRIHVARIGAHEGHHERLPAAILWSKAHAHNEFPLVLGTGTDAVSVDAWVYYKIREDRDGVMDYAYHVRNPVDALQGFGMRALMEQTRSATLEEVLSVDRAEFARRLEQDLRHYVDSNRLGLEIVDLALINLHPPVASAAAYLDVISAEIDAVRFALEAEGESKARIQEAEAESGHTIAEARARASRRVGQAVEESAQFVAVGQAYSVAPDAFVLRLSGDTLVETMGSKPLTLIDPTLVNGDGELLLDLRPADRSAAAAELR